MPKLILQGYAAIEGANLQVQPFSTAGSKKKSQTHRWIKDAAVLNYKNAKQSHGQLIRHKHSKNSS
jgi:hypothetical protein